MLKINKGQAKQYEEQLQPSDRTYAVVTEINEELFTGLAKDFSRKLGNLTGTITVSFERVDCKHFSEQGETDGDKGHKSKKSRTVVKQRRFLPSALCRVFRLSFPTGPSIFPVFLLFSFDFCFEFSLFNF